MRLRIAAVLLVLVLLAVVQYLRPIPRVQPSPLLGASTKVAGTPPPLPWPGNGSAALGAVGLGVVATSGPAKPQPIASVAKVMTALVLLDDKPLPAGQQGPSLTVTASDVADYAAKRDDGQSVVVVAAGEQLNEFQLLEGLLVPSGNNIADLIARWDSGSVQAFVDKMNAKARSLGLRSTFFADASGYDPKTVSTPSDLVRLGVVAISNQMIADVVSEGQAQLPVAGTVYNVDYALGQGGIAGIKTGSSPQAGACFLFSSTGSDLGRKYTLVGAVVGVSTLDDAFAVTKSLIKAAAGAVHVTRIASKDQAVGRYQAPWSSRTDIVASSDLDVVEWPGTTLRTRLEAPAVEAPLPAGSSVGDLYVKIGDQESRLPVVTSDPLFEPGNRWRLTRTDPFF